MDTHLHAAHSLSRADTLLVFLPGAFLKPEEFEREGFVDAVRQRRIDADVLIVDANVSYYYDQTFIERLQSSVIQPQRERGYKSIWLVGISIGGFGALIHELASPGSVDGIVTIAPYLGRRPLGADIARAGGLRSWRPLEGPPSDSEADRLLWPWLQQYAFPTPSRRLPPLYLGFGTSDRFACNHKVLAEVLPEGHVFTTEGGHDWPQWARLWRDMLQVLPLPILRPVSAQRDLQALATQPATNPVAIGA
ncbi:MULTISPECIES: alpha/beta fold hydrolase [unclassified Variovorax]|uniref:alpha/beta fold hydrolase n=1 Tax=unclassified Variovorax TaxID=663243 RepID=UPI002109D853|nr:MULTISPECIES: alpha/beta hydrolase [unclassified Variovorax]